MATMEERRRILAGQAQPQGGNHVAGSGAGGIPASSNNNNHTGSNGYYGEDQKRVDHVMDEEMKDSMFPVGSVESQYNALHEWLMQSIDVVRDELLPLDFLLFAFSYFEILGDTENNEEDPAEKDKRERRALSFYEKFAQVHSLDHQFELDYMVAQAKDFSERLRKRRIKLKASRMSEQLLLSFLATGRPAKQELLAIVNRSIEFDIQQRLVNPSSVACSQMREADVLASVLNGADDVNRQHVNAQPVRWAVPRRVRVAMGTEAAPFISVENEPNPDTPLSKSYIEKLTQVPSASSTTKDEATSTTNVEKKPRLTSEVKWPSIAMMSMFNASDGLISFSSGLLQSSARIVVGGFEQCNARIWTTSSDPFGHKSFVLEGHSQPVYGVAVHGSRVLTCSGDGTIRLWLPASEVSDGSNEYRNVYVWETLKDVPVWAVQFAPFGGYFATGGRDGSARIWAVDAPKHVRYFWGHLGDVDCVAFHPNSHYLFTGSADKTLRMWDIQSGKCVRIFVGHSSAVECIAVHPSGRIIASGGMDGLVIIWDVLTGKRLRAYDVNSKNERSSNKSKVGGRDAVYALAWSPDGAFLATAFRNKVEVFAVGATPEETLLNGAADDAPMPASRQFTTKCDPVLHLNFIKPDVLLATGVYQQQQPQQQQLNLAASS